METENQTQTRREELESLVKKSKREILVGLAKTAGYSTLPVAVLGGIVGATQVVTYPLENSDVKHLFNIGIPFVMGGVAGLFIGDYVKEFKDMVDDIRYTKNRMQAYQKEFSQLE